MSKPFLITGLPRSRTAWLAVAASTVSNAICYHEPIDRLSEWQDIGKIWKENEFDFVGVSDSIFGFHLGPIIEMWSPQILIVDRDRTEVERSLSWLFGADNNYCELLSNAISPFLSHKSVRTVKFNDLSSSAVACSCLRHLMPGADIRLSKIEELQSKNIQTDLDRSMRLAKTKQPDADAILGRAVTSAIRQPAR